MKKDRVAYLSSLISLSISTLIWRDIFLFSKIIRQPAWVDLLPSYLWPPHIISLICLIPIAFISESAKSAVIGAVRIVLIAPGLVLAFYIFQSIHKEVFSIAFNSVSNYAWIIAWNYTPPALLLIVIRYASAMTPKNKI